MCGLAYCCSSRTLRKGGRTEHTLSRFLALGACPFPRAFTQLYAVAAGSTSSGVFFSRELKPTVCFAVREMILHPYETQSDSFYFVDNKLVMHNKADYSYSGGP